MVRIAAFDWDGPLIPSWGGHSITRALKSVLFRVRRLYLLGELLEACLGIRWRLHAGAERLLSETAAQYGLAVGIITDRSLFSFVISARRAGLALHHLRFVHARSSLLDGFVRRLVPPTVTVFTTPYFKGDPRALVGFVEFCNALGVKPPSVLFVGDNEQDRLAASQYGFWFVPVDKMRPQLDAITDWLTGRFFVG